jgi:Holliday junction resolvase RusA-like endonuclease
VTEFTAIIHQAPLGKGRPRATVQGGHARVYTPTATADWEHYAAVELRAKYVDACLPEPANYMTGPLGCEIVAVFPRTAELLRKVRGEYKHPTWRLPHATKPDADNIAKSVLDAVEKAGIISDDKRIALLTIGKHYAMIHEEPRVEVRIWSLT